MTAPHPIRRTLRTCALTLLLVILTTALAATSCVSDSDPQGADLRAGDKLPQFTVTLSDGSPISTAMLAGKPSLIMFFTTTCPDCQAALPVVQQVYDATRGSITLLCISRETAASQIAAYWEANGLTLPYAACTDRSIYNLFATDIVPRIYISSPDLTITAIHTDTPPASYETLMADISSASTASSASETR